RVKPLVKSARDSGMPACAMTDQNNVFAMVKFYGAAQQAGIKPILGVDAKLKSPEGDISQMVFLCANNEGYQNLTRLISDAWLKGQQHGVPYIHHDWLEGQIAGLIALSGGRMGDVGQALLNENTELAKQRLAYWQRLFPDSFYLELQRTGRPQEEDYLHAAVDLAIEAEVPVVATNDVRFLKEEDYAAHEVRVGIHDGYTLADEKRESIYSAEQYLRTPEEMIELFSDIPEAIENTVLIAQRCNLELRLGENFLPDFPVPEGHTVKTWFCEQSRRGLEERLEFLFGDDVEQHREEYEARLELELDVILTMDFPGYFLIVADFIQWSKDNDVPVGPGRGSGAGSLVAYALGITDLDPLAYDLLFERFLNPERVSMPDFDVDFCMDGRDRVIDYVAEKYGRDKVSQIITYGSMAAKAVVRDVGRVVGHPYGFVDQIAKLVPFELGITLDKALEQEEALRERYNNEEDVHELLDMARSLEGLTRNVGKHAGGVVISPSVLTDFSPLFCETDGSGVVTQFDKDDVESVGLVKFDFLGLRTLTIIDWALKTINAGKPDDEKLEILRIPLDDRVTFERMKTGQTTAVFQLESRGMQELIKRLKPDCFEDIVALVALFRPGPLQSGMVDDFIDRKHGKSKIEYPHPDLEPILQSTYGVILYQEQVQRIAQVLAGYTLGGADLLRRAMGKKKPEEMAKQRDIFTKGALERGVDESVATYIFDLMEKFAGYGFNKSHSAAYALVSYQTAWLKVHHPAAFMAAVLSSDMDNTDKVVMLIDECRKMGLELLPPDVNRCDYKFTVSADNDKAIHYGLGAIKGAGEAALNSIAEERKENGHYQDLFDFCRRIDKKKCNRRLLEALIKSGAMDDLLEEGMDRAVLMASLASALKMAEQEANNQASGQDDLFGVAESKSTSSSYKVYAKCPPWPEHVRLAGEKETLGLYLTGHPISQFLDELRRFIPVTLKAVRPTYKSTMRVTGLIMDVRYIKTRNGRMAVMTLDDQSARMEAVVYTKIFEEYRHLISPDQIIIAEGEIKEDEFSGGNNMKVTQLWSLDEARKNYARKLALSVNSLEAGEDFVSRLQATLTPYRQAGACPVAIQYQRENLQSQIVLGESWRIQPSEALLQQLKGWLGPDRVMVDY
ncbi:MAG: DNA polymerase III subunit alpha, partial [Pseudomonadota bacterium]